MKIGEQDPITGLFYAGKKHGKDIYLEKEELQARIEKRDAYYAKWREQNRERRRDINAKYAKKFRTKKTRKSDPLYHHIRDIRKATVYAYKTGKHYDFLGCSGVELRQHLENMFSDGMNHENFGEWEIDHIIPLSSCKSPEEVKLMASVKNLQPLWKKENAAKRDKIF